MTGKGTGRKKSIVSHIEHIRFLSTAYLYSMENALKIEGKIFIIIKRNNSCCRSQHKIIIKFLLLFFFIYFSFYLYSILSSRQQLNPFSLPSRRGGKKRNHGIRILSSVIFNSSCWKQMKIRTQNRKKKVLSYNNTEWSSFCAMLHVFRYFCCFK